MGSKNSPSPPPPVDPNAVIGAEAQANRVNQITPYGSLTYGGPNNNTATLNLSPEVQNLFNSQLGISQGALNQANYGLQNLPQGNPYASAGIGSLIPQLQIPSQSWNPKAPTLNQINAPAQLTPNLQTNVQGLTGLQNPNLQQSIGGLSGLQNPNLQQSIGGLNFGGAAPLPQNYSGFNQDAANAFFNNSSGLLNQQFNRDQQALDQKLANLGLQSGGAAYGDQYNQFLTNKNQTFGNLANQAVLYGGQDASRQLADQLALRGAGTNEAQAQFGAGLTQGNFANQAALSQADVGNQNALAQFNAGLGQGQFANQAALSQADVANQNAQAQFGAGLNQGNFTNQALQNQFGMGTTQWGQNLTAQQLPNDIATQQFGLQNQQLGNQMNLANQANATRGQSLAEIGAQRDAQFNQLASLLGLQQVQSPTLGSFSAPGQVNAGDAYALQQAGAQNNYNTQANNAASKKGSTANLAGTLGGAAAATAPYWPLLAASDRRLKKDIQKIGQYKGYNIYLWAWNKVAASLGLKGYGLGVMADEIPLPFVTLVGEYLAVDYGAL